MSAAVSSILSLLPLVRRLGIANVVKDLASMLSLSERTIYAALKRLSMLHEAGSLRVRPLIDSRPLGLRYLAVFRRSAFCNATKLPFLRECIEVIPTGCIYILYAPMSIDIEERLGTQMVFDLELQGILVPRSLASMSMELVKTFADSAVETLGRGGANTQRFTHRDLLVLNALISRPLTRYRDLCKELHMTVSSVRRSIHRVEHTCFGYSIQRHEPEPRIAILLEYSSPELLKKVLLLLLAERSLVRAYISLSGYALTLLRGIEIDVVDRVLEEVRELGIRILGYYVVLKDFVLEGLPHVKDLEYDPHSRSWSIETFVYTLIRLRSLVKQGSVSMLSGSSLANAADAERALRIRGTI